MIGRAEASIHSFIKVIQDFMGRQTKAAPLLALQSNEGKGSKKGGKYGATCISDTVFSSNQLFFIIWQFSPLTWKTTLPKGYLGNEHWKVVVLTLS